MALQDEIQHELSVLQQQQPEPTQPVEAAVTEVKTEEEKTEEEKTDDTSAVVDSAAAAGTNLFSIFNPIFLFEQ